jgi:hypothetical protein
LEPRTELEWGRSVEGLTICALNRRIQIGLGQDMSQQWETAVANEEKPNEKARAIRARQRVIGRELRRMYDDVAQEPVPDDFLDLLRKIDDAEDAKSGKKVS